MAPRKTRTPPITLLERQDDKTRDQSSDQPGQSFSSDSQLCLHSPSPQEPISGSDRFKKPRFGEKTR